VLPDPLHRLLIHLMLRTGLRAGEVGALTSDAIITMRDGHWLRVPVGKLHNDRYIPLHPHLLELLTDWRSRHDDHGTGLLLTRGGKPLNLGRISRIVTVVAHDAGLGHVHPTSSGTPSPPKPSTAGCASKPSDRCSATRRCG